MIVVHPPWYSSGRRRYCWPCIYCARVLRGARLPCALRYHGARQNLAHEPQLSKRLPGSVRLPKRLLPVVTQRAQSSQRFCGPEPCLFDRRQLARSRRPAPGLELRPAETRLLAVTPSQRGGRDDQGVRASRRVAGSRSSRGPAARKVPAAQRQARWP